MQSAPCCQNLLSPTREHSPFSRIIALGWFDGPTSGVIQCARCSAGYKFETVDRDFNGEFDPVAWDRGEEIRIVTLASLPMQGFERLVGVLSRKEAPRWPIWAPLWTFPSENLKEEVEDDIKSILSEAQQAALVLASHNLLEDILIAKEITPSDMERVRDWFSFLGIEKK